MTTLNGDLERKNEKLDKYVGKLLLDCEQKDKDYKIMVTDYKE